MSHRILLAVLLATLMGMIVRTASADDAKPVRLAGQLTKIDGKNFTIASETDGKETTIICNDATQYRQDGSKDPVTLGTFKVGQKVRAYYRAADNVALTVILAQTTATTQPDKPIRMVGNITKIDGTTLTIKGLDGTEVAVTCNDATKYSQDGSTAKLTLDAFKVGQKVRTYYRIADKVVLNLIITTAN